MAVSQPEAQLTTSIQAAFTEADSKNANKRSSTNGNKKSNESRKSSSKAGNTDSNANGKGTTTVELAPKHAKRDSMDSVEPSRDMGSQTREEYSKHIDDEASVIKQNQEKSKLDKKKELVFGPGVIWYLAKRYRADKGLSWHQYIRHFLPYPLITLCAAAIQVIVLILLQLDTESDSDDTTTTAEDIRLVQARLMALAILTAFILMTGKNIRDFIHVIAFDAIFQDRKILYVYILLPIGQGLIEAYALYISAIIILDSTSVVDVFKDAVAIMFVLEVDQWMGASLNMRDLGLTSESLEIDFSNDESNVDEVIVSVVYGGLLVIRFGVVAWAVYLSIYGTFVE